MGKDLDRRSFLRYLGSSGLVILADASFGHISRLPVFLMSGPKDDVELIKGLTYEVLIKFGERINASEHFGSDCDFIAFLPYEDKTLLWVNHEYLNPDLVSGFREGSRSKEQLQKEKAVVGGSIIAIEKHKDCWKLSKDESMNRRLTADSAIPFSAIAPPFAETENRGTLANCSGGVTPWGTVLTCEENYDSFYGDRDRSTGEVKYSDWGLNWGKEEYRAPENYGWVVEVNPLTGEAKKHTSLGRFMHECATVAEVGDQIVVFSGDDSNNQCLYKMIPSQANDLSEGELFVADLEHKKWRSLDWKKSKILRDNFKDQIEVLTYCREAAKLVGGTPLDRPEDIEIDPISGDIFVSLTKNTSKENYYGSILRIEHKANDYTAQSFEFEHALTGGENMQFACPDNLVFDKKGNLWFTTDISSSKIGKGRYGKFKSNSLFVVKRTKEGLGELIEVARAPIEAEFTGPAFSDDYKTLFLSVQHPGEKSTSELKTSNWPDGGKHDPRSAVITIQGTFLEDMMA